MLKKIIILALGLSLILGGLILLKSRFFYAINTDSIYLDDEALDHSIVYRNSLDELIVLLANDDKELGLYLVSANRIKVSVLSRSDFFRLPGGVLSRYYPLHSIPLEPTEYK